MASPAARDRNARTKAAQGSGGFPSRLAPQLAALTDEPPSGDDWVHEIKYDGYRMLARISGGRIRLLTRNGKDWSARFPAIAEALASLPTGQSWLDGEVVALRPDGTSSFAELQQALSTGDSSALVYVLFDAPWLDGESLMNESLVSRKQRLQAVLSQRQPLPPTLRFSDGLQGNGADFFQQACAHDLEGVISKRASASYRPGRSNAWVKSKCHRRQEFVVAGFTESASSGRAFGALLLGLFEGGRLRYTGRVGTGFNARNSRLVHERLVALTTSACPFDPCPPTTRGETVHWVRPELVAEVRFGNWTADGVLRHASFQGLREDKPATAVGPEPMQEAPPPRTTAHSRVKFTNPDKVLYPEWGLTKLDLARYYELVAEPMLALVSKRPLTLVRCPEGHQGQCFFQKHLTGELPAGVVGFRGDEDEGEYPVVKSLDGLLALVQLNALELHGWGSRTDRPDRPDQITFDLDPGPKVPWSDTVQAAQLLRVLLEGLGLQPFLKATGGKGLHLVVPIVRRHSWEECKSFSKAVAQQLVRFDPKKFSSKLGKAGRADKIFVDYLRNGRGATAVVPYSTRARPGAPVALPLHWDELDSDPQPDGFRVADLPTIEARIADGDPWAGFNQAARQLTAEMWAAVQQH